MVSEIGPRLWTGEQRAAAPMVRKRFPRGDSYEGFWLAETRKESWTAGLGPIVANHFQSGLLDIPP